jgi:potassium voltage-gated channel Eag-related subfamily H protein 8
MSGKYSRTVIPGLSVGGAVLTSKADIASTITSSFSTVCSSDNYDPDFRAIKNNAETLPFNFTNRVAEAFDAIFTMDELHAALDRCCNKSPGPDGIHNEMLSHLPLAGKQFLLSVYNRRWAESTVPDAWKEAVVIPVLKPGTDRSQAASDRPIGLTSCLCKTVERMVNCRVVWVLENQNLFPGAQCGFRRHRSAPDYVMNLEYHIQNAFLLCHRLVAVLFDLEKAYGTTWRCGILRTLHRWKVRGRLPLFLSHFLQGRYFCGRLGNVLSARYPQENWVRQGPVLSVTLLAISITRLVNAVGQSVTASLCVDYVAIYYNSRNMGTIECRLQDAVNRFCRWTWENGFTFSPDKTECLHFIAFFRLYRHLSSWVSSFTANSPGSLT